MYRTFVVELSRIGRPLVFYIQKHKELGLPKTTIEQVYSFITLKSKLVEPSILALPQAQRPNMIDTGVFANVLEAVLLQQKNYSNRDKFITIDN